MLAKYWTGFVIGARIFAVVFAAAVPIGIGLHNAGHIEFSAAAETWVWIVGLVVLGVDNLGTLISRKHYGDNRKLIESLDGALMQLLVGISKSKSARLEELGASIWVRRRFSSPRLWRTGEVPLRRLRRFRPMNYPHQSNVAWSSRMGAVGACWEAGRRCYRNLWRLSSQWDEAALDTLTDDQFAKMSAESRSGFTYAEFKQVAGKYSEVVATPIFSATPKPKIIGVLSLDRGMPDLGDNESFVPALDSRRVREDIEVIVELIGRRLTKPE